MFMQYDNEKPRSGISGVFLFLIPAMGRLKPIG